MAPVWVAGLELALGVLGLARGWAWLAPRLSRRGRLVILGLLGGLAVGALALTAGLPHDYRPGDLGELSRNVAALTIELLVTIVGGTAALATIGRRRTLTAQVYAVGVYLVGVGLVLYGIGAGQLIVAAPLLVLAGTTIALAGAARLVGLPRWLARGAGLTAGLVVALSIEALRGVGTLGGEPATAARDVWLLVGGELALLLGGGLLLLRAHGRVLTPPLTGAATALGGTALVIVLRGPGEWVPGPDAASTTLYGLPLTGLVVAACLILLDRPLRKNRGLAQRPTGSRTWVGAQSWSLLGVLLLFALTVIWHPAPDPCIGRSYAEASPLTLAGLAWAQTPDPAAPRSAPGVPSFDQLCTHRTLGLGQLVYAYYPSCKWAQVDPNYPLVQASGTLRDVDLSRGDAPWIHTSHDVDMDLAVDPASSWLVLGAGGLLHVEAEGGRFPVAYWPVVGDRLTVAGRWVYDCGHDAKTEIHPAAIVAAEHAAWRIAAGAPRPVHVLQVWMNSAPGVVSVPLAPFALRAGFPPAPDAAGGTPFVQVVAGSPAAVQWTIETGAGRGPEVTVQFTPPGTQGSAYFELLLGYPQTAPPPSPLVAYTVAFDRLLVHNDLRQAARNTTGVPAILSIPQLGFSGTGHWHMQALVDHTWRNLLEDAPVVSGHSYPLAGVPSVAIWAPGGEHLRLAVTGYADNDPSDGVTLAAGSVTGAALLNWDAGPLVNLCCDQIQTVTPLHGAWTLAYHVRQAGP